jgi:hypothetical protein
MNLKHIKEEIEKQRVLSNKSVMNVLRFSREIHFRIILLRSIKQLKLNGFQEEALYLEEKIFDVTVSDDGSHEALVEQFTMPCPSEAV